MSSGFDVETRPPELEDRDRPEVVTADERARMRAEYGRIRTYFKLHPERHRGLQRSLNQARIGATYDEYLATSVRWAMVATLVGVLVGVLATVQLAEVGIIAGLENPLAVRGGVVEFVGANRTLLAGVGLAVLSAATAGAGTWYGRYYYPSTVVSSRRQAIDIVLPHAIVYMYALSQGGMSLFEVMRKLADADDVYGEVAHEFEMIVTDIELFGSDTFTALQNARNLTPSENLEQFLDDLVSVLDSGGDLAPFLEEESRNYLREAEESQESFLETLALLAEVFVVGFVAAPLFLIVTLVVISLIGGNTIEGISVLVYLIMPLAMGAFLFLIGLLSQPYEQVRTAEFDADGPTRPEAPEVDDGRVDDYASRRRRLRLRALLDDPVDALRDRPVLTLAFTVPLAVLAAVLAATVWSVPLSPAAFVDHAVVTTTAYVVVPFLVVAVPLSAFHELKRRRQREIADRFPDTLNILSSANKMGIPLVEGLDLVSRWSTGVVAREIRTVRNDIEWNHDPTAALLGLGRRLRVPQLARTMTLLADGMRSSGDLSRVLSVAAEDTRNRARLDRARRRELSTYIVVVAVGFLVYLLVVVMLDASFLQPVADAGTTTGDGTIGDREVPVSLVDVPVDTYHAIFFHSALIQAVGSGLLAGKLADNDALAGLKYGIALVVLTLGAFALI